MMESTEERVYALLQSMMEIVPIFVFALFA
jgi:hypothetical protein